MQIGTISTRRQGMLACFGDVIILQAVGKPCRQQRMTSLERFFLSTPLKRSLVCTRKYTENGCFRSDLTTLAWRKIAQSSKIPGAHQKMNIITSVYFNMVTKYESGSTLIFKLCKTRSKITIICIIMRIASHIVSVQRVQHYRIHKCRV